LAKGKTMNALQIGSRRSQLFSCWVLLAVAWLAGATSRQPVYGTTLQDLLDGGFIGIGNQIEFFDWQLISLDATAMLPDLSQIEVNALANDSANPGLQFVANGQLSIAGINAIDLVLKFGVQIVGNSNTITGHSLAMTGINFGGSGGIAYISDELRDGHGADLGTAVAIADNENDVFQFSHTTAFSLQSEVFVTTNLFITGLSGTDTINLSTFTQRFSQIGPPVLPGDYNHDGAVDAADYVVWRKTDGSQIGYNIWRANVGATLGGGAASATAAKIAAVPEPIAATLAVVVALMLAVMRYRAVR
jgi:hypothetical protein